MRFSRGYRFVFEHVDMVISFYRVRVSLCYEHVDMVISFYRVRVSLCFEHVDMVISFYRVRLFLCFEHVDMAILFYRVRVSNVWTGRALGGQVPRRLQHATGLHELHELLHEGNARALQEVLSRQDSCSKTGDLVKL